MTGRIGQNINSPQTPSERQSHTTPRAPLGRAQDVLVVESGIGCNPALWGELLSIFATTRIGRLAGAIIDGAARDRVKIQEIGYPVFARRFAARKTQKEHRTVGL